MFKYVFVAVGLSMLLSLATFSFRSNSGTELTSAELNAMALELRNAAIDARNTRVQMSGRTWVFAFSGSSQKVTDGDVERAKLALSMASK